MTVLLFSQDPYHGGAADGLKTPDGVKSSDGDKTPNGDKSLDGDKTLNGDKISTGDTKTSDGDKISDVDTKTSDGDKTYRTGSMVEAGATCVEDIDRLLLAMAGTDACSRGRLPHTRGDSARAFDASVPEEALSPEDALTALGHPGEKCGAGDACSGLQNHISDWVHVCVQVL